VHADDALRYSLRDRFLAIQHTKLAHDVGEVIGHAALGDAELERDVGARHAVRRELEALPLARTERRAFEVRRNAFLDDAFHEDFVEALSEEPDVPEIGRDLPAPWLMGWSFGTDLALRHGRDPSIKGAILISPPLRYSTDADLAAWAELGKPLIAIVPEFDDYLRPDEAARRFAAVPQATVIGVPGAKHLFVGYTETVLNAVVAAIAPDRSPLPREYD